jgi:hypothetical protein
MHLDYLWVFLLLIQTSIELCPSGSYESDGKCYSCSVNCLQCSGPDLCEICQPHKALYKHKCVDFCPNETFSQFNDTLNHTFCLDPTVIINYTKASVIFPFNHTRNSSQRSLDILYLLKYGSIDQ